jgi:hypothetical protein
LAHSLQEWGHCLKHHKYYWKKSSMSSKQLKPLKQCMQLFIFITRWWNIGWIALQKIRWESGDHNHIIRHFINSSHFSEYATCCHSCFRINQCTRTKAEDDCKLETGFHFKSTLLSQWKPHFKHSDEEQAATLSCSHVLFFYFVSVNKTVSSIFLHVEFHMQMFCAQYLYESWRENTIFHSRCSLLNCSASTSLLIKRYN